MTQNLRDDLVTASEMTTSNVVKILKQTAHLETDCCNIFQRAVDISQTPTEYESRRRVFGPPSKFHHGVVDMWRNWVGPLQVSFILNQLI